MVQPAIHRQTYDFDCCAVIVAHPDDETLWAGGTMLMHPETQWTIVTLSRKTDPDRSLKFFRAIEHFNAKGEMGDLDDSPSQPPLVKREIQDMVISLLPPVKFDLIITHNLLGEYTRHRRHEEIASAVLGLWKRGELIARELWMFAYEDSGGTYLPRTVKTADRIIRLPEEIWQKKYDIITKTYGFTPDSFEAKTTPLEESFWCLRADEKIHKTGSENNGR